MTEREREAVDAYVKIERFMDTIAEQKAEIKRLNGLLSKLREMLDQCGPLVYRPAVGEPETD